MINLNELARTVALQESGKQEVSIAQIKEIMKILFCELAYENASDVLKVIEKYE